MIESADEPLVTLPEKRRGQLKEPMGEVYTDAEDLLAAAADPLIAVGDVVTAHLLEAGRSPDVAVIDGQTEREAIDRETAERLGSIEARRVDVGNPAGGLTKDLLRAIREAVTAEGAVLVAVDGEEDLATIPAIIVAPNGASVVYGQPGQGMVLVTVTAGSRRRARAILDGFEGDVERAVATLVGQ